MLSLLIPVVDYVVTQKSPEIVDLRGGSKGSPQPPVSLCLCRREEQPPLIGRELILKFE